MAADPEFAALVERVGAFHLSDRELRRLQANAAAAVAAGRDDAALRRAYLVAVRRYFEDFRREARERLREVDRRLEQAAQVQFNLGAERGVAVKRVEATEAVLATLSAFAADATHP